MAISKSKKEELVTQYTELLKSSKGIVLTTYSGLTVKETEQLRGKVREAGGKFHVVKNRLVKLAFEEVGLPIPEGGLEGTTAMGFAEEDFPALAKVVVDLAKESDSFKVKGGLLEGELYEALQIAQLAELPPLPIMRARLMGLLQAPAGRVAGALAGSVRQVMNVLNAFAESGTTSEASA